MSKYTIRNATRADCQQIRDLIMELAVYEKLPEQVKITTESLEEDGFGDEKFYHCLVADVQEACKDGTTKTILVAYAMYYFTYSTWEGRSIYMEDLYVKPEYRQRGIGTDLWKNVAKVGLEKRCSRFDFVVLDWNKSSIEYYNRKGAIDLTTEEGWHLFRMKEQQMKDLVHS